MTQIRAAQEAAARSELYRAFAEALVYPDAELQKYLAEGGLNKTLARLFDQLCSDMVARLDTPAMRDVPDIERLQSDYLFLFEVGTSGTPPCPLFGGTFGGIDRRVVMEECVRFYEHFGLRIDPRIKEMPDALGTQLEFLHFMAYSRARLADSGADASSYERGESDFLERHLGRWLPLMRQELVKQSIGPWYREVIGLLADAIAMLARNPGRYL
jgi:putative dimethyl sulfoxide reductase chaperone